MQYTNVIYYSQQRKLVVSFGCAVECRCTAQPSSTGRAHESLHRRPAKSSMTERALNRVLLIAAGITDRDVATLTPDTKLYADLGLDSAAVVELVVELEDAFDIQIGIKDTDDLQSLRDVAAMVRRLTKPPRS